MTFGRIAGPVLGVLLASTTATGGNDTVLLVSEGVICLQPECDPTKPGSIPIVTPLKGAPALIERIRYMSVSSLHTGLPVMSFESWLFVTLRPYLMQRHSTFASWQLGFCDEPGTAMPQAGPHLCIETEVLLSGERTVHIAVEVAKVINPQSTRLVGWRVTEPTIRWIYIQNSEHSVALKTLPDLAQEVSKHPDDWPMVDLKADLKWSPEAPKPGETVQFTVSVSNLGTQDLERAQIKFELTAPNHEDQVIVIRREWFPAIAAGKTVTLNIPLQVARGEFSALLTADPFDGIRRIRESNPRDNEVVIYNTYPFKATVITPSVDSEHMPPP